MYCKIHTVADKINYSSPVFTQNFVKNCDKWDLTRRNTRISPQTSIHTYFESRRLFGLGIIVFFWVVNSYFQRKDKNKTSTPGVELPVNYSFQDKLL